MDHIRILRRAFQITLNYRALWVFGFLLALTAGSYSGSGGSGGGGGGGGAPVFPRGDDFNFPQFGDAFIQSLIGVGIALLCLVMVLAVAGAILRYVSEVALIRLVDTNEATGEKMSVRQGFRLGWSRSAWRIFLIDLLFGLAVALGIILLLVVAAAPLLLWLVDNQSLHVVGTVAAIGLGILVILLAIVVSIVLSLVVQFVRRAVVLEGLGVVDGIRRGYALVRQRLGDVILMGVLLFAAGILVAIVMIPLAILLFLAGLLIGGLPGLFLGWITSLFISEGALPFIVGGLVALPLFLLVVALPLAFLGGLVEVFYSSTWTLTYREALALGAPPAAPALVDEPVS